MTSCQARRNVLEFGWVITTLKQIIEKGAKVVQRILGHIFFSQKELTSNTWAIQPSVTYSKYNMDEIFSLHFYLYTTIFFLNSLHVRGHFKPTYLLHNNSQFHKQKWPWRDFKNINLWCRTMYLHCTYHKWYFKPKISSIFIQF